MKKYLLMIIVVVVFFCFAAGCRQKQDSYSERVESHPAMKLYRDGVWKIRYRSDSQEYTDEIKSTTTRLTIDVKKNMTEEDILDIMDYYELTRNARFDFDGSYIGERETDYTCYAVFYQGETDQETRRIKYYNGEEVEIPEEEKGYFPSPASHTGENEIGEWP